MKFLELWRREADRFQAIVFDIDGTLLRGPHQLPGAAELLGEVRLQKKPLFFLTNDGDHTLEQKCSFLVRAGLTARPDEIINCLSGLESQAKKHDWVGRTFFAAGELGELERVSCVKLERDLGRLEHCAGVILSEGVYDWRVNWEAIVNFFRRHPERLFIVPNPDGYWPSPASGIFGIGAGGQARCIQLILKEMGVEIEPIYLGKPYAAIYEHTQYELERRFGVEPEPERILMLGDSLASDVRGANRAGFTSALVLTGITTPEMAANADGEFRPGLIFDSIA